MIAVDETTMTDAVLAALGQVRSGSCDPEAGFAGCPTPSWPSPPARPTWPAA